MRTAIYLRIATEDHPQVSEKQLRDMQALAVKNGWEIAHIYRDTASTGKKDQPALQSLLSDAEQHRFDILLFWSLNQLSRHGARNTILLLHKLSTWHVSFYCYTEPHLDSCHAQRGTVVAIVASMAQQDHTHISERTRAGLTQQQHTRKLGPKGCLGPGRPPVDFDQTRARALRAKHQSYAAIASVCGVSKATISRFLSNDRKPATKEPRPGTSDRRSAIGNR